MEKSFRDRKGSRHQAHRVLHTSHEEAVEAREILCVRASRLCYNMGTRSDEEIQGNARSHDAASRHVHVWPHNSKLGQKDRPARQETDQVLEQLVVSP